MRTLIRRYLEAGVLATGVVMERHEGTPQGGPLSPLLANVLLDVVDQALERRGHRFVRYADDCNVYVQSKRAAGRVMAGLSQLYAKLKLRVNTAKSAVAPAKDRQFLGYSFWYAAGGAVNRRVAPKALGTMQERVRQITSRTGGRSLVQVVAEGTLDRRSVRAKLVACGSTQGASHRSAGAVLRISRSSAAGALMNLNSPNRRMRTRMSGGVGGK